MSIRSRYSQLETADYAWAAAKYGTILFILLIITIPYIFVIATSFTPSSEVFGNLKLLPSQPTLDAWIQGFKNLTRPLINSFLIASGTAVLSLLIAIPSAYVFGRKEFPGKELGFYLVISALLFPYVILVVPIVDAWLKYNLYNTIPGLWIAYQTFVTPFSIWVLRDFFEGLPDNIEEAAQVYGCTQFSAFARVVLPLAAPAIAAVGFLAFLTGWNDFLFSNLLINSQGPTPAVVALYNTVTGGTGERIFWNLLMAETIIVGLPPLILYLLARNYITDAFSFS
jgi:ABC-type glycerol-3-phosphate transport system permease component